MSEYSYISEEDFDNIWGAASKPNGELWPIHEIQDIPQDRIWTVYEDGSIDEDGHTDNNWYATPGIVQASALGFLVTRIPWDEGTHDAIWYFDTDEFAREERRAYCAHMIEHPDELAG